MQKINDENKEIFKYLSNRQPSAIAEVLGGTEFPTIKGVVEFYSLPNGVIVVANIENLPKTKTNIFAFHIHNGTSCDDDFANAGTHYNPTKQDHPNHAGDMPPLFAMEGTALSAFFDQHFKLEDVLGKVVIIHDNPDDFTTQPSGNSGNKIACGVIKRF